MIGKLFEGNYNLWREKRYNRILKKYGEDFFKDKTLLELGCGEGDLGNMFSKLGAIVTCVDGRKKYIDTCKELYPHLQSFVFDLNVGLGTNNYFDIILHTGLLYHLINVDQSIIQCTKQCNWLILETEVCNSFDPHTILYVNEYDGFDQSLNAKGSRPSPEYIERILQENNFSFEKISDELNIGWHIYDWERNNTKEYYDGLRAFWFCEKRTENIID